MTLQEYKLWARTKRKVLDKTQDWRNASLGVLGELGEIADTIKKWQFHGHELDHEALAFEFGDLIFYLVWQFDILWPDENLNDFFKVYEYKIDDKNLSILSNYASKTLTYSMARKRFFVAQWLRGRYRRKAFKVALWAAVDLVSEILQRHYRLSNILEMNVSKLDKRYPQGFSEELSKNRGDDR